MGEFLTPFKMGTSPDKPPSGNWVTAVAFSIDGLLLAGSSFEGYVFLLEFPSNPSEEETIHVRQLKGLDDDVTNIAFSPSGDYLAAVSVNGRTAVWPTSNSNEPTVILTSHKISGGKVIITDNAEQLMVHEAKDGQVKVWSPINEALLFHLDAPPEWVLNAQIDSQSGKLITANADGSIRSWPTERSGFRVAESISTPEDTENYKEAISSAIFSSQGDILVIGGSTGISLIDMVVRVVCLILILMKKRNFLQSCVLLFRQTSAGL